MTSRQPAKSKVPNPAACTPHREALTDKDGQQDRIPPGLCASQAVFFRLDRRKNRRSPDDCCQGKVAEYGHNESPRTGRQKEKEKKDAQTVYF